MFGPLAPRRKNSLSIKTNLSHAGLDSNHVSNRTNKTSNPKPKIHLNPTSRFKTSPPIRTLKGDNTLSLR